MRLINRAEFAKKAGVSRAAVSKLTGEGGTLFPAMRAGKIDIDHPAAAQYLAKKNPGAYTFTPPAKKAKPKAEPEGTAQKSKPKAERPTITVSVEAAPPTPEPEQPDVEEDVTKYLGMTLREIIERHGTDSQFKNFLDARKHIEDIKAKEFNNAIKSGEFIPRQAMTDYVFPAIDNAFRRLVDDMPTAMARTVRPMVLSGSTNEEIIKLIHDYVSKVLKTVKRDATKATGAQL